LAKYIYKVVLDVMEKEYLKNAQEEFFKTEEERSAFNAELVINASSEDESYAIRRGMTDIRMWELDRIEE
jgi:hypothetical protein